MSIASAHLAAWFSWALKLVMYAACWVSYCCCAASSSGVLGPGVRVGRVGSLRSAMLSLAERASTMTCWAFSSCAAPSLRSLARSLMAVAASENCSSTAGPVWPPMRVRICGDAAPSASLIATRIWAHLPQSVAALETALSRAPVR